LADTFGYFFYQFLRTSAHLLGKKHVWKLFALDRTDLPDSFVEF
jgi:hypothetical protein